MTLLGRRREPLEAVAAEFGGTVIACDITDRDALENAIEDARAANGPLDYVILNAGIADSAPFGRTSRDSYDRIIATNLTAVFDGAQLALPDLLQGEDKRLVVVASVAGLGGIALAAPYAASKHGAVGLVRSLALEFAKTNLTVNAVCPAFVDTPMTDASTDRIVARTGRSECGSARGAGQPQPQWPAGDARRSRGVDPAPLPSVEPFDHRLLPDHRRRSDGMTFCPSDLQPKHFLWDFADGVATITLNRPERKNPLTFESYDELRATFWNLDNCRQVKAIVITGAGGNFCSGGDVHEIIGPLTKMDEGGLLRFTRMTGDLVRAMRACPQPIIAAVEGICAGAGRDHRHGQRPAPGRARSQGRLPVHAGRPQRRGHGRLRHIAADSSVMAGRRSCSSPAAA